MVGDSVTGPIKAYAPKVDGWAPKMDGLGGPDGFIWDPPERDSVGGGEGFCERTSKCLIVSIISFVAANWIFLGDPVLEIAPKIKKCTTFKLYFSYTCSSVFIVSIRVGG